MRILISNDDGIHAEGMKSLVQYLKQNHQIVVVAPYQERSATGHTISLGHPLRVAKVAEDTYACDGFPADCILLGLKYFSSGPNRPDLVISGINLGPNLSQDIYYSGTVAAAREASIRQVPGIAVSLATHLLGHQEKTYHFETATHFISRLLEEGVNKLIPPLAILNVNIPNLPLSKIKGVALTRPGFLEYSEDIEERIDLKGRPYYWIAGTRQGLDREEGTDSYAIYHGLISLSLLGLAGVDPAQYDDEWKQIADKLNQELVMAN